MKVKRLVLWRRGDFVPRRDASGDDAAGGQSTDLATFWQQWLNWQAPVNQRGGRFMMRWRRVLPR